MPEKLSKKVRSLVTDPGTAVYVSAISCAELACAVERGRIKLDRHWKQWFRFYIDANGWECLPIDLEIIEEAYSLPDPFHPDPADRIITATARLRKFVVITADRKIIDFPHVDTMW